jgi:outer membrane biosynthesis protein TonB
MTKATTTEAPSAKPAKKAPAKAAPAPTPTVKSEPAPKPVKKAAVKPPVAATAGLTAVVARVDVGFGNLLFIRGDGPGLSWDRGVPMDCVASDQWTWSTAAANRPFACKVLINDERWSAGEDYVVEVGVENAISPVI